ncbi:MAG: Asp-tRNA(Asn)/Glu-tRNA(Gln) amidotransferase subunit GatC [Bacteroidia bacterium]|nr:Asp-tRNA(Asn)/Glu-tRNA(Gln) amidotransferase subunit GatC [Bacteroidia bacterium]
MEISDELLDKLAHLARLDIPDAGREALRQDLKRMLEFVDQLQAVDTAGVEPLIHLTETWNQLSEDQPEAGLDEADAFRNSPSGPGPFFRIPRVVHK